MTEGKMQTCPICKLNDEGIVRENAGVIDELIRIKCPRCKVFTIRGLAEITASSSWFGPKLSAWIQNRNEQHVEVPEINSKSLEDIQARLPDYSPREKQIILLQNIERMTAYPGKAVKIDAKHMTSLWPGQQAKKNSFICGDVVLGGFEIHLGGTDMQCD